MQKTHHKMLFKIKVLMILKIYKITPPSNLLKIYKRTPTSNQLIALLRVT